MQPRDRKKGKYIGDLNVDRFNMQILQVVHAKFSREYLPFFAMMATMYSNSSKRGKEIREQILWINHVRAIIDSVTFTGKITPEQTRMLYNLFDKIEDRKQGFLDDVRVNQSMQQKMDRAAQSVGVSVNDLNLTKGALKAGVKQARKKPVTDEGPTRRRSGIHSSDRIRRIGEGMKVAAFGPFTPLVDLAADINKLVSSWSVGRKDKKESRISSSLGARHVGMPAAAEPISPLIRDIPTGFGMPTQRSPQEDLFAFFNNKAYKAKWTKELLDRVGKIGRPMTAGGTLTGGDGTKLLKYAATIATSVASIKVVLDLFKVSREAKEAGRKAAIASTELGRSIKDKEQFIEQEGLQGAAERMHKTSDQVIRDLARMKQQQQKTESSAAKALEPPTSKVPWYVSPPIWLVDKIARKAAGYRRPEVQSVEQIQKEYERKFKPTGVTLDPRAFDGITKNLSASMKSMEETMKKLMESNRQSEYQIRPPSVGNPYDPSDPLINQLSAGQLTAGGK